MILSDKMLRDYIQRQAIRIFPEFNLRDIRPAGIRLHLGSDLLVPVEGQLVDLGAPEEIKFDKVNIIENGYLLKPGKFVLGSTYECFQVPRNIVCHIDGRSTMARIGLAIHCTSGIIDGNYEEARSVVLEMTNHGPFDIILRYKAALAMLSFNQLTSDIEQKTQQQYHGQNGVAPPNLTLQKK